MEQERTVRDDEIVVGTHGSQGGRAALAWAVAEAARSGRWVRAVRVWDPAPLFAPPAPVFVVRSVVREDEERALESDLAEIPVPEGVRVEGELLEGVVVGELVAQSAEAAMLVVGSHGHGPLGRAVLGSVSAACVRRAGCPVVVVTPRRAAVLLGATGAGAATDTPR